MLLRLQEEYLSLVNTHWSSDFLSQQVMAEAQEVQRDEGAKANELQAETGSLQMKEERLTAVNAKLMRESQAKDEIIAEKDDIIAELKQKVQMLEEAPFDDDPVVMRGTDAPRGTGLPETAASRRSTVTDRCLSVHKPMTPEAMRATLELKTGCKRRIAYEESDDSGPALPTRLP